MSALSNARWLILIQGYKITLQLVAMAVLTRLLPPSDYGLMAMAWTAANFAALLKDLGTSSAIIQKKTLTEETKSTVFWLQMGLGATLCLTLIAMSGVIAAGFKQPALAPILCLLALTFPLGGLSTVHQALLERQSHFRILARIEIVSSSAGLLVAGVSAWQGAGVYSFVWQSFTVTLLYVIQSWFASRWRPRVIWDKTGLREIFGYSGNLSAFNLIIFATRNADSMIIGRFLGASALGTYSMAYKLMLFPLQNLTNVAGRALFPVISRQQDSNQDIARLYVRAVAMVGGLATPMMAGLYVLRHPLSRVVFGGDWGDVANVITWLAPVGAIQALVGITGAIYAAKGRTDILFRMGIFSSVVVVSAFFLGLPGGLNGIALAYFIASFSMFIPQTYFASRLIGLPYATYVKALVAPVASSAAMIPLVSVCFEALASYGDLPALIASSCAGALIYFVLYMVLFRNTANELLRALLGAKFASAGRGAEDASGKRTWLFIDIAPTFGGHEVMLLRWIDELNRSADVVPILFCVKDTRLAELARDRCKTIEIERIGAGFTGKVWLLIRLIASLLRSRINVKPELAVVAEGSLFAQRFGLYAARIAQCYTVMYVPIVDSFTSIGFADGEALDQKVKRFYGKLPHAWLTITENQALGFRAWADIRQPIFTLPNTVAATLEAFGPKASADAVRQDHRMKVLVLGRLEHHQKGLDSLLAYLRRNPDLADRFVIHFVGEGPYAEILLEAKKSAPCLDRLITLEPWANAVEAYARHDALLLPSRFEGVPLVMLEAMAFGLPVIASDLAGTRAYLSASCLVPVGDFDGMFSRLAVLHTSRWRAARIKKRNLLTFQHRASGAAFSSAVMTLTQSLRQAAQEK